MADAKRVFSIEGINAIMYADNVHLTNEIDAKYQKIIQADTINMHIPPIPDNYEKWLQIRDVIPDTLERMIYLEMERRFANIEMLSRMFSINSDYLKSAGFDSSSAASTSVWIGALGFDPEIFHGLGSTALAWFNVVPGYQADNHFALLGTDPAEFKIQLEPVALPSKKPYFANFEGIKLSDLEKYKKQMTKRQKEMFYRAFRFEMKYRDPNKHGEFDIKIIKMLATQDEDIKQIAKRTIKSIGWIDNPSHYFAGMGIQKADLEKMTPNTRKIVIDGIKFIDCHRAKYSQYDFFRRGYADSLVK